MSTAVRVSDCKLHVAATISLRQICMQATTFL